MTNLQLVEDANVQIVHEVYDLLSDPNNNSSSFQMITQNGGTEWLLMKPSVTAPLRKLRFSTFKPIYKPGIVGQQYTASVKIKPIVVNNTSHDEVVSYDIINIDGSTNKLYSVIGDSDSSTFQLPFNDWTHEFTYNGSFEDLSHNINDTFDMYFKDFFRDGHIVLKVNTDVYISQYSLRDTSLNAYGANNAALKMNDASNVNYALISFNNTNLTFDNESDEGSSIKTTFVWTHFATSNYFLVFTFDIDCNNHAFSVNTGDLYKQLFTAVPPALANTSTSYAADTYAVVSYDDNITARTRALVESNMLISLCSSFAGNLTGKIFTGENLYHIVDIETFPSSMYFPINLRDKNNQQLTVDQLKLVYEQITIGIDYVYLTY